MEEKGQCIAGAAGHGVSSMPYTPRMRNRVSRGRAYSALQLVYPRAASHVLCGVVEGHGDGHEGKVLVNRSAHRGRDCVSRVPEYSGLVEAQERRLSLPGVWESRLNSRADSARENRPKPKQDWQKSAKFQVSYNRS